VDTIDDGRSGFLFSSCNALGLKSAISRALSTYRVKPRLDVMRRHASAKSYDWGNSAPRYVSTYKAARA
jgi:starch synthase